MTRNMRSGDGLDYVALLGLFVLLSQPTANLPHHTQRGAAWPTRNGKRTIYRRAERVSKGPTYARNSSCIRMPTIQPEKGQNTTGPTIIRHFRGPGNSMRRVSPPVSIFGP